jgi:toxin ParE1/3/4
VDYYDTQAEGLGDQLAAEVPAAVAYIERFPEISPIIESRVRRMVLAKFPYDLFYVVEQESIVILSVAHERRRPGSWRARER